ncbi:MAG: hypothetical protein KGJ43_07400 [Acidobacteriota bacterium]|nr:hypothetical protein [Acidobacteriota bacterium]
MDDKVRAAGHSPLAVSADVELAGRLAACAASLVGTAHAAGWRGADPYDGLHWGWPGALVSTSRRRQLVVQAHARAPIDLRAWRRQKPPRIAKTLALCSQAALGLAELTGEGAMERSGRAAARMLAGGRAAGESAWGYPFPVQTRWSYYAAGAPNVVASAFAIEALVAASDRLGEPELRACAEEAAGWVRDRLVRRDGHIAYHEQSDALIHNANLLGALALHRARGHEARDVVRRAVDITLAAQRDDGSWPYGAGGGLQFVDSFHTAYVLRCLIGVECGDPALDVAVRRGAEHWAERFFDGRGRARLWGGRRYPEDGHAAGTALSLLPVLAARDAAFGDLLRLVARRALSAMVRNGRVVHRRYRLGRSLVSYVRWCDAHMAAGMVAAAAHLALADRHASARHARETVA